MPTIQQILQDHFDELAASGTLSAPQQRAGWALRKCRTAALGGHVQRCPNGHVEQVWYNSCLMVSVLLRRVRSSQRRRAWAARL